MTSQLPFDVTRSSSVARQNWIEQGVGHELCRATVGTEAGHKAPFKRAAEAVGLAGKMTATVAGPELAAWAAGIVEKLGAYPAGALSATFRKKQSTCLLKVVCPVCEYTARVTRKWIEEAGAPWCPADGEMEVVL